MILKQEWKARSAVVAGCAAAAAWLALAVAGREFTWWTVLVIPAVFGLCVWLLGVAWIAARRARRLRALTELSSAVEPASPEWTWFERAWTAVRRVDDQARRALPEPLRGRLREQVEVSARELYHLAGYASELTRKMRLLDGARFADEAARLRARRAAALSRHALADG